MMWVFFRSVSLIAAPMLMAGATVVATMGLRMGLVVALVLPLVTLDQTLFDIYADMAGLRAVIVGTVVVISLLGVYGAARIGRHFGDWPGALFTGGLAAVLPLFC